MSVRIQQKSSHFSTPKKFCAWKYISDKTITNNIITENVVDSEIISNVTVNENNTKKIVLTYKEIIKGKKFRSRKTRIKNITIENYLSSQN